MPLDSDSIYILILLCLPLQFNILTNSFDQLLKDMRLEWIEKKDLTYYENYFCKKAALYSGMVSSLVFIFVFYKIRKMKLVLSIIFILNGITWLIYLAMNENRIVLLYILRSIQGIYLGCFQMSIIPYMMNFASSSKKCFCGCLIQFSMFFGLFILNLLCYFLSWKVVVIIFCVFSFIFSGLIWFVPEIIIPPKNLTHDSIFHKENFHLIIIMLLAMLLQQLSGIAVLIRQLSRLLAGIGLDIGEQLQACLFNFVGTISVINSAFMTDIVSTKYMWCVSAFGLCIGLAIYAATLKTKMASWIGSLGVFVYFLFYGLGEGPIPWYLCGTMFNEGVRLESSGLNTAWNLFLSPLMEFIMKKMDESFDLFWLIMFSSIWCLVCFFFGLFVIPYESREEIDNVNIL